MLVAGGSIAHDSIAEARREALALVGAKFEAAVGLNRPIVIAHVKNVRERITKRSRNGGGDGIGRDWLVIVLLTENGGSPFRFFRVLPPLDRRGVLARRLRYSFGASCQEHTDCTNSSRQAHCY